MISGRGSNMKAILENTELGTLKGICKVEAILSNKKDAKGLEIARNFGVQPIVIESKGKKRKTYNSLLLEYLQKLNPDYIILAGYMKIISPEIIEEFSNRIINIHPADTDLHQGLHGYEWAFENSLKSTKITVHYVDEGLDTGIVIGKREVDLSDCETLAEVEKKGLKIEHQFYSECLRKIFNR